MALTSPRRLALVTGVIAVAAALVYLRDPAWLIQTSHGFHAWETDEAGTKFRWTTGHASFFVPADAALIEFPMAASVDAFRYPSVMATITIDDRPAERVELTDGSWRAIRLRLPPRGRRRVRRIDVRVNRTQPGDRGVRLGEIRVRS